MQQFPQVSIARNLLLVLRAYQQEFGLTPAARSRIAVQDAGDDLDERGLARPVLAGEAAHLAAPQGH